MTLYNVVHFEADKTSFHIAVVFVCRVVGLYVVLHAHLVLIINGRASITKKSLINAFFKNGISKISLLFTSSKAILF